MFLCVLGIADAAIPVQDQGHDPGLVSVTAAGHVPVQDHTLHNAQHPDHIHVLPQGPALHLHADQDLTPVPDQNHHTNLNLIHPRKRNLLLQSQNRTETSLATKL